MAAAVDTCHLTGVLQPIGCCSDTIRMVIGLVMAEIRRSKVKIQCRLIFGVSQVPRPVPLVARRGGVVVPFCSGQDAEDRSEVTVHLLTQSLRSRTSKGGRASLNGWVSRSGWSLAAGGDWPDWIGRLSGWWQKDMRTHKMQTRGWGGHAWAKIEREW